MNECRLFTMLYFSGTLLVISLFFIRKYGWFRDTKVRLFVSLFGSSLKCVTVYNVTFIELLIVVCVFYIPCLL